VVSSFDFSIVSPAFAGHAPISVLPLKCYFFSPVIVSFFVFAAFCFCWLLRNIYVSATFFSFPDYFSFSSFYILFLGIAQQNDARVTNHEPKDDPWCIRPETEPTETEVFGNFTVTVLPKGQVRFCLFLFVFVRFCWCKCD